MFSAYVMPQNIYLPYIHILKPWDYEQRAILPKNYLGVSDVLKLLYPHNGTAFERMWKSEELLVLVCGHASQDARCGVYGPLLSQALEDALGKAGIEVDKSSLELEQTSSATFCEPATDMESAKIIPRKRRAKVAVTSHVGGHAFAGNVGIWFPKAWTDGQNLHSSLAGHGIWYGRVEPKHVEGIVAETVLGGRVIGELLRGGYDANGQSLTATKRLTWPDMPEIPLQPAAADPYVMPKGEPGELPGLKN